MSKKRPRSNNTEYAMVAALDRLADFEDFCKDVHPLLRQAIKEGWGRDKIDSHPKIQALMAARQINIALSEVDSSKALAAIKDHRDRTQGKPKESKEITHKYDKLKDDELDALLLSESELPSSEDTNH